MEDVRSALAHRQCAVRQDILDACRRVRSLTAYPISFSESKVHDSGVPWSLINVAVMYPAYIVVSSSWGLQAVK